MMSTFYGLLALVLVVQPMDASASAVASSDRGALVVTYLANEGFLIEMGETKILIDALFGEGLRHYEVVPPMIRRELESATGRFAGVDLILATHIHDDHFDADAVARHLRANPTARFISTRQAVERLDRVDASLTARAKGFWPDEGTRHVETFANGDLAGVTLTVFNLHHGRQRRLPIQNLGLLLDLDGHRLFHIGDTEVDLDDVAELRMDRLGIDVAFVPTWFVVTPKHRRVAESFGAEHWIVMHMGAAGAPAGYFYPKTTRADLVRYLAGNAPQAWVPTDPLAERTFGSP
ncbi:MAG: MBL fold metallo-hydrolase [Acidobacteriota bacterium]